MAWATHACRLQLQAGDTQATASYCGLCFELRTGQLGVRIDVVVVIANFHLLRGFSSGLPFSHFFVGLQRLLHLKVDGAILCMHDNELLCGRFPVHAGGRGELFVHGTKRSSCGTFGFAPFYTNFTVTAVTVFPMLLCAGRIPQLRGW